MFGFIGDIVKGAVNFGGALFGKLGGAVASIGLKPFKHFIDDNFRDKTHPVAGSVVYCDLMVGAEHSGIFVDDDQISNVVVQGIGEREIQLSSPRYFSSKSIVSKKIYVSCDSHGRAVGDDDVADYAESRVGERGFYGLVFKNCHEFSTECVNQASYQPNVFEKGWNYIAGQFTTEYEPTIRQLKIAARNKLKARKWLLWDWQREEEREREPEPDWDAHNDMLKNLPLTPEFADALQNELGDTEAYLEEISDENIPPHIIKRMQVFVQTLKAVKESYDQHQAFLRVCGHSFTHNDLQACQGADFSALAKELQQNQRIQDLTHKMGRNYVSEERKKQGRLPQANRSEVHGTHYSDDIMRLLPSELVNLDNDTLENLFYARLLEKSLVTYELSGSSMVQGEITESEQLRTGPVVACLDTSGSMQGMPLLKAQASLFAIASILKREKRDLYVLLFGSTGQIREFRLEGSDQLSGLLKFLQSGFNGGTDFETPLKRAVQIIQSQRQYVKADILMLSDGDCSLSNEFVQYLDQEKIRLNCMVYSVLCHGHRVEDNFSDEVLVL